MSAKARTNPVKEYPRLVSRLYPADEAAAIISALLDADAEKPRGRPRLSREAVAYLRGAADALAAAADSPWVESKRVESKRS